MDDVSVTRPVKRLAAVAFVVTFVVAGCTSGGDSVTQETTARSMPEGEGRVLPAGDEPTVLGPLGQTDAEFETDDGLVQVGSADVPDSIADSFPIPDDLQVQLSSQAGAQAGFSGVTAMAFGALVTFYETELAAAGYDVERTQFVDGVVAAYDFAGSDGSGQLAISSAPGGGHSVLVTFEA